MYFMRVGKYNRGDRKDMEVCVYCNKLIGDMGINNHDGICEENPVNKRINCEFCGGKFNHKNLLNHQRKCGGNPNIVNCEICDSLFKQEEYELHKKICNNNRNRRRLDLQSDKQNMEDKTVTLMNILSNLSKKLNYRDIEEMLNQYDMICSVCYEPTDNKINICSHPICIKCLMQVTLSNNPKCPVCRINLY